ncbi:hypothetical protein T492DRAFT_909965, partial [Pavlovales sp. CCMP2436]
MGAVEQIVTGVGSLSASDRLLVLRTLLGEYADRETDPQIEVYDTGYVVYAQDEGAQLCSSWLLAPGTNLSGRPFLGFIYLVGLAYIFLGIAIISDIFMAAIEVMRAVRERERELHRDAVGVPPSNAAPPNVAPASPHRLLPTACCPLFTACCPLPTACCPLPAAHCLRFPLPLPGMVLAMSDGIFMAAIEVITASEGTKRYRTNDGKMIEYKYKLVNPTIANLTLMALGSSAPEILLSIIGVISTLDDTPDELGPSTIVGSAAFNLLLISAICISALPEGETK